MTPPVDSEHSSSISDRITQRYAKLPPQEQRAAAFVLEHLEDVAVYSATELAQMSGVSKATVSRMFRTLGFQDSRDVRAHARELRRGGAPDLALAGGDQIDAHLRQETTNIANLLRRFDREQLRAAAAALVAARRVLVIGERNSYPIALHLRTQLMELRGHVDVAPLPGQSLTEELLDLGEQDMVIVIGMSRRSSGFGRIVKAIGSGDATTMLIADAPAHRVAAQLNYFWEVPVASAGAFSSYAAAMSAVCLLADIAASLSASTAEQRIQRMNQSFQQLGELEQE